MTKNLRNRLIIVTVLIIFLAILSALSFMSVLTAALIGALVTGLILRTALIRLVKAKRPVEFIVEADPIGIKLHDSEDFKKLHQAVLNVKQPLNLAFEGGGARGAVYVGAVHALEQKNLLLGVKNVAGSSAGGITAFLLALGSSASAFKKLNDHFNLATLVDRKPTHPWYVKITEYIAIPIKKILRFFELESIFDQLPGFFEIKKLFTKNGIFTGKVFMQESKNQINELLVSEKDEIKALCPELENLEDITFKQFHEFVESDRQKNGGQSKYKDLFLTGTLLGGAGGSTEYFSWVHSPDVKLVDALRITMSFPGAFVPHVIEREGIKYTYVDGGVYKNLPAKVFDKDIPLCEFRPAGEKKIKVMTEKHLKRTCNPYTLNFKVDCQPEFNFYTKSKNRREKRTFFEVGLNLAQKDQISKIQIYYPYNTIVIHDMDIGTLQFELNAFDKLAMFLSGEVATNQYFKAKETGDLSSAFPNKDKQYQLNDHAPLSARLVLDIKQAMKRDNYKKAIESFKHFKMIMNESPEKVDALSEIIKNELATLSSSSKLMLGDRYTEFKNLVEKSSSALPFKQSPSNKPLMVNKHKKRVEASDAKTSVPSPLKRRPSGL